MRIYSLFVYVFLYTPIAIIALFSFSAGRSASQQIPNVHLAKSVRQRSASRGSLASDNNVLICSDPYGKICCNCRNPLMKSLKARSGPHEFDP